DVDYDGDGLHMIDEYRLWVAYGEHKTSTGQPVAAPNGDNHLVLLYSDGKQYSRDINTVGYDKQQQFLATAGAEGQSHDILLNFDSGVVPGISGTGEDYDSWFDTDPNGDSWYAPDGGITDVERYYYDRDYDTKLSDDELDEDADGLPNYFEAHGPMQPGW